MSESLIKTNAIAATAGAGQQKLLRLLKNPMAVGSLVVLALVILSALFASQIAGWDPNRANLNDALAPPFGHHLLGADASGRDILARLLFGSRISLIGALIALVVALIIGIPSGLVAGYYQGWFGSVSGWCADLLMALPGLIVVLAMISVIGPGMLGVMATFGVLFSPGVFRLTRSGVISVRNELYVDAAKVSGLSDFRIISRHVLGVVRAPLMIQASMIAGIAIVLQAGLEFLGVGDSSTASWGQILSDAFANIYVAPMMILWPGLMIGITVGALALFGNALRDTVQGAEKVRRPHRPSVRRIVAVDRVDLSTAAATVVGIREERDERVFPSGALLEVRDLRVGYPQANGATKVVVDGVSFYLSRGEVLGLVGESGSGKSQTAFSILGLLPDEGAIVGGSISFEGRTIASASGGERGAVALQGRQFGYVPQEPMSNLDPCFTLGFQLAEPMRRVLHLSRAAAKTRALELLDRVGIADPRRTFDAYPHEVSGGMAQRVLIAGAVACDPELLVADEPTTALDVTVQAEVLDLLRGLQDERNMGMILVTHNFGVVADICDRVAVMQAGQLVEQAEAVELFDNPQNPYTKMLLESTLEDAEPRVLLGSRVAGPSGGLR